MVCCFSVIINKCVHLLCFPKSSIPKNYPWPGNFRELEQAVRNIIVHDEFVPLGQGSEIEFDINQVYANTQVSLNGWSQIYAKKAYENAGS